MTDDKAILDLLGPLMRALEMLAFVARHVHPPDFDRLMESVGAPDEELRAARARQGEWPRHCRELAPRSMRRAMRSLRLFPGCARCRRRVARSAVCTARSGCCRRRWSPLPARRRSPAGEPVLSGPGVACRRGPAAGLARRPRPGRHRGHALRRSGAGRVLALCAETYAPTRLAAGRGAARRQRDRAAVPLELAADARSRGAILAAPTSIGSTWALMRRDPDTPNLARILDSRQVALERRSRRLLLTGMSDGGTFTYVSGLDAASPFTHLAPVVGGVPSAAAANGRSQIGCGGYPSTSPTVRSTGCSRWSWRGRRHRALARAGANVTYREIDDLSHTYPREINATLLDWMSATPATPR